ncbi:MAG: hypothetical protein FWD26_04570 [Treponema sp.]|nr:hypothetical protein [Treponema sp.]
MKKVFLAFLLIAVLGMSAYGQMTFGEDFKFTIGGEMSGMITFGLQGDDQVFSNANGQPPGVYFPNLQLGTDAAVGTGKNGYYNNFDLVFFLSPVSSVELYAKFKTRYQIGGPYLPFQLDSAGADRYEIKTDAAWARANAIKGLGFDFPLDIWLKVGKFKAEASHYNRVSRFGVEGVLDPLQTGTHHLMQMEVEYPIPVLGPLALSFTTNLRLNEEIKQYYDVDSEENPLSHYHETGLFSTIPIHVSLKFKDIDLSFVRIQAELLYALNGLHIASGHSFGAGIGAKIFVTEDLTIPIGIAAAFTEKNIDPFVSTGIEKSNYPLFYQDNGYSLADSYTIGLRQSLRAGFGIGVDYTYGHIINASMNVGFAYSQIAHIYRDTLTLFSLAVDLRTVIFDRFVIGGGVVLGSLTDAEWKVKAGVNKPRPGDGGVDRELFEGHTFSLLDNLGFEVYCGLIMKNARFVAGYNMNRGLSMSRSLEALPDAQIKYRQPGTGLLDGKFQRGGVFTKLVINL